MSSREREGLIARIRQLRRIGDLSASRPRSPAGTPVEGERRALEHRIAHLEQLVQGLQDSVHRESKRQTERIAALEAQIRPEELARTLSEDARTRGL
jgi:hypothetical protein